MPVIVYYIIINFAILVFVLWLVGRKMVVRMFKNRREQIERDLDEAKAGLDSTEKIDRDIEKSVNKTEQECAEITEQAKKQIAEQEIENSRLIEQEKELKDALLAKELENYRLSMLRDAQRKVVDQVAKALKDTSLNLPENFDEMCAGQITQAVSPGPGDAAYLLSHNTLTVTISSANLLKESVADSLKRAVTDSFGSLLDGKNVDFMVKVDSSLVGGVRLRVGDTVYNTSVKRFVSALSSRADVKIPDSDDGAQELASSIKTAFEKISTDVDIYQFGKVVSVSDGICHISGISDAMYGELLELDCGVQGMVLDLEKDNVSCVLFGKFEKVEEGCIVRRSGHIIEVPVGEELLGRVVDALGKPIDGLGEIHASGHHPVEFPAAGILDRESVTVPLHTGIKAIDALVPIGRGQRELIIGDRQTGKTALAIDTILNQKDKNVICIYVAIGQKESTVAGVLEVLKKNGAMENTIIVCADAFHSAPMQYIAPYAGTAMGEYFMYSGRDVLIVYDDLSKHAVAYRELSLLLHRPSGREAYPGDVFYLHSRLLERSARLNEEAGGGSMTALPIIETQAGDISAYIPTNAISITDGQVFLESQLFHEGQRPAVNVGLSVSRVGGAAQTGPMRQISGRLRMDLAQYRELASFSQFGSDLDQATKDALAMGERMTAVLRQAQYSPLSTELQVLEIYAVSEGFANNVDPKDIQSYENGLVEFFKFSYPEVLKEIANCGKSKMSPELCEKLREGIRVYGENRS